MDRIVIERYANPCIRRGWDFMAYLSGDDAEGYYGFGATELEAVKDLLNRMPGV